MKITGWFRELWNYRELIVALTSREIKVRYKQTLLGASWAILQPVSLTIIFSVVFGLFLKINSGSIPYPIFAYSALLPWTFFSTAIGFGALSVVNNGNLVTKVYFPREILPLSSVGAAFFDFIMASFVFIAMLFFYKIGLTSNVLYILIIIPSILLFTIGVSFFLSAINVIYRDVRFVVPLLLQIWLFLTPIIYSASNIPEKYRFYLKLNPLVSIIENFRSVTVYGSSPDLSEIFISLIISFVVFIFGYWFFKSKEKVFADLM